MSERTHSLRVERTFDAPREALFRAWTTPDHVKQWLHPSPEWSTPVAEIDLRVGGAYRFGVHSPEQGTFYEVGEYREIRPPERLVYTCRYEAEECNFDMPPEETLVTVEFHDAGSRTRVVVVQEGYRKVEDRDAQQQGWPGFLETLARFVEGGRS
jgi:uncharacterized protein YndB with AHSA1/START domain